jgi:hypothetical protein
LPTIQQQIADKFLKKLGRADRHQLSASSEQEIDRKTSGRRNNAVDGFAEFVFIDGLADKLGLAPVVTRERRIEKTPDQARGLLGRRTQGAEDAGKDRKIRRRAIWQSDKSHRAS